MSARNAFGYYLLKRAQQHIISTPVLNWDAHQLISRVIDKHMLNGAITPDEQQLVFAVNNYIKWEDLPDSEPIGPCVEARNA